MSVIVNADSEMFIVWLLGLVICRCRSCRALCRNGSGRDSSL